VAVFISNRPFDILNPSLSQHLVIITFCFYELS
jgi:hypothetical protein